MNIQIDPIVSRSRDSLKHATSPVHYHNTYELYYMHKGQTSYFIADEIYSIEAGNFVFIPKGIIHSTDYANCSHYERFLINFPEELLAEEFQPLLKELEQTRIIYIDDSQLAELEDLMGKIELEYHAQNAHSAMLMHVYITELLILLCRYKTSHRPSIRESDRIVYDISEYINTHFPDNLTLELLCDTFSISKSYLSRKFKAVTGIGLNKYITYVRVTNAEKMLSEGKLSVAEIARRCGYNDSSYFALVFKSVKGITPFQFSKGRNK